MIRRPQETIATTLLAVAAIAGARLQHSVAPLALLGPVAALSAYVHPRWRPSCSLATLLSGALCCLWIGMSQSVVWISSAILVSYVFGDLCRNTIDRLRITARREHDRAEQTNCIDVATESLNRVGLELVAPPVIHAARRRGDAIYAACVRVDGLVEFAGREGPDATERLMREVADTLRVTVRASDLVARTGDAEFHIVGPGGGVSAAGIQRRCHVLMLHRHDPVLSSWKGELRAAVAVVAPWEESLSLNDLLARATSELEMKSAITEVDQAS